MTMPTALSGKTKDTSIDLLTFTKAFVAGLITQNAATIRPKEEADRRGFESVIRLLDAQVNKLLSDPSKRPLARSIARIANELRPSNSGSFEGFESALRALQLTFAKSPNPWYDNITFAVPKPFARETIDSLPEYLRTLVNGAAKNFVQARGSRQN